MNYTQIRFLHKWNPILHFTGKKNPTEVRDHSIMSDHSITYDRGHKLNHTDWSAGITQALRLFGKGHGFQLVADLNILFPYDTHFQENRYSLQCYLQDIKVCFHTCSLSDFQKNSDRLLSNFFAHMWTSQMSLYPSEIPMWSQFGLFQISVAVCLTCTM